MSHHGARAFHGSGHGKQKREQVEKEKVELAEEEEEEEDPFDTRIKKSGCADLHYALLVSLIFLRCSMVCTLLSSYLLLLYRQIIIFCLTAEYPTTYLHVVK